MPKNESPTTKFTISYPTNYQCPNHTIVTVLSTQYVGNHMKTPYFGPKKLMTLIAWSNDKDTRPHLLSLCNYKFLKCLINAKHNATTQQFVNLVKSCTCIQDITHSQMPQQRRPSKTTTFHHGPYYAHAIEHNVHAWHNYAQTSCKVEGA